MSTLSRFRLARSLLNSSLNTSLSTGFDVCLKVSLGVYLCGSLVSCRPAARPDGTSGLLALGALAPDATGQQGEQPAVSLQSLRGQAVVMYFYPRDATPGCTREACAFRDVFEEYDRRGVVIFGISQDSAESHRKFSEQHHLPFPLVADEDGKVSEAYGVGSLLGFNSRVTFLISPTGRIAHVWPDVDPGVHAKQVLQAIDDNGFSKALPEQTLQSP